MISASKYQHIISFMSLLKVSLCINGPKQRLLCMDTRRGAGVSAHPPPEKKKKNFSLYGGPFCYYFSIWRALCYVFLLMRAFFIVWRPFCYLFFTWGAFLLRLPPGLGPFSQCGRLFCLPIPPMFFFECACYYVTFIPCPPPSLTAAIMYPTKPTATPVFNSQ